ncbi:MAG: hypothetical protein L6R41_004913 [Letrouitia leprolyta]|nr:MAG: hypothetical protein L6R41_004913 [Letrouitia leprolyta]
MGALHETSPPISPSTAFRGSIGHKRTLSRSEDSGDDGDEGSEARKRPPGVKRACNECRQQKLRCDVVQMPTYKSCSRCKRLKLECKIDSSFKRVGKRSKNMEMEKEIQELRRQLANQQSSPMPAVKPPTSNTASPKISSVPSQLDQYINSEQAVNSLLDLRSGHDGASHSRNLNGYNRPSRRLEGITLAQDQIHDLFHRFFTLFHPFMPLLEPAKTPDSYYDSSTLLFWIIISVAARHYSPDPTLLPSLSTPISHLLWATLADVPQSYIVVKALCILCTWPLPISSTSKDPTFMLNGMMMQVAMQIGLHRPSHAQDFARFKIEFREEELKDRVKTWVAANMVSQRVATGYGQPPSTFYDWTLVPSGWSETNFQLPEEVEARLNIERFCNKATRSFYTNRMDPVGLVSDEQRSVMSEFLARDLEEIEEKLPPDASVITFLYLRAAGLHFRLSAFFDSPESPDYHAHLLALWQATSSFLECVFNLDKSAGGLLLHASNYILQMIIAAGFALLKLLNSFFADKVKLAYGRELFLKTIQAIRTISVATNDLPSRLAEVLAQLWKSGGSGLRKERGRSDWAENSLQLKVRCRMSMSLVYDSVWRWREEFQAKGRGNLESECLDRSRTNKNPNNRTLAAVKHPTNPDSNVESSASSIVDAGLPSQGLLGDVFPPSSSNLFGESNYEVFDPLGWMLDGYVNFPFDVSETPGLG